VISEALRESRRQPGSLGDVTAGAQIKLAEINETATAALVPRRARLFDTQAVIAQKSRP
jgi:hypothetical protein